MVELKTKKTLLSTNESHTLCQLHSLPTIFLNKNISIILPVRHHLCFRLLT